MATSGAQAAAPGSCDGGPFADGVTITCSGNSSDPIYGSGSNATVTLSASSSAHGDTYVALSGDRILDTNGDHNTVTFGAGSVAYAYDDNKAVNFDGSNNTMTLNGGAELTLNIGEQNSGTTLDIDGNSNVLTLNGASSINLEGDTNSNYARTNTVNIQGEDNSVVLSAGSAIELSVYNDNRQSTSTALVLNGDGSKLTLNSSTISANVFNDDKYANTTGAEVSGTAASVTLNGSSLISVYSNNHAKYNNTTGLQLSGDGATLTLNDTSAIGVTANSDDKYASANGARVYGDGTIVTLNGASHISVDTNFDSIFGDAAGLVQEGDGTKLTLNGTSSINLTANGSDGGNDFYGAQISGDAPVVTLNGTSSINVTGNGSSGNDYVGLAVSNFSHPVDDETVADINVGSVTLNDGSSVNVTLNGGGNVDATGVVLGGNRRPVRSKYSSYAPSLTLNGTSSINVTGYGDVSSRYVGVIANGKYANITLNDSSSIQVYAEYGNNRSTGIQVYGNSATITLNDDSVLNVGSSDTEYATGIYLDSNSNSLTLNDNAAINVTADDEAYGVRVDGYSNTITLNGDSAIKVDGDSDSVGIYLDGGANNHVVLNDNAGLDVTRGTGVLISEGYNNTLTLNSDAHITAGDGDGVVLDDATSTSITLNGRSSISATDGAGIRIRGSHLEYDYYYEENVDVPSRFTTISINDTASVTGDTGILLEDGAEGTMVYVHGTVTGTEGTAIDFRDGGKSTLAVGTGGTFNGNIIGSGRDSLLLVDQGGTFSSVITGFNYLGVDAAKDSRWNLTSTLDLDGGDAEIFSGQLAVNGTLTADTIHVYQDGTLGGSGTINGDVIVEGLLSPGNSPGTLTVVGNVTLTPGAVFKVQVEGDKADLLNVIGGGTVTIDPGTTISMEFLGGADGFVGDVIASGSPVVGTFTTFLGGVFDYSTPGFVSLTAASPSAPNAGMTGASTVGFTFLDAVIDNAENGIGRSSGLWGTGLYNQTNRTAMGTAKGVDVQGSGLAMGGDVFRTDNLGIGLAAGYIDSTATTEGGGSDTDIKGYNVAAYTTYGMGNTFFTAAATGAYQDQDVSRRVLSMGGLTTASSAPEAWTAGAGASLGHTIPVQGAWTLTPRAGFGWQHVSRDGYSETGGGLGAMSVDKLESDTLRGQVGAELAVTIKDPNAIWSVRPSIRAALAKELRSGDSTVNGSFLASGAAFSGKTDDRDQTYTAIGAGVDVVIGGGLTAFAQYDGAVGGEVEKSGGVRLGARFEW